MNKPKTETHTVVLPAKPKPIVYDIRSPVARELGHAPDLWTVIEDADPYVDAYGIVPQVFARAYPNGGIRILPKRAFHPGNVVTP